jgi:glutamate synthase domain-containing protein 3
MQIDAANLHYRELNDRIRQAVAAGETEFTLTGVNGQRYIADGLRGKIKMEIHGVPGNDLGAFMDGPEIVVHNNAQDAVANTMNEGRIVVRGDAGDVLGYGMRGGRLYVRGNVGYRVGIHMKAFREQMPIVIVGEGTGDFLGEYMAGGLLVVLSLGSNGKCQVGDYCATGMHGGSIYLRGEVDSALIATEHVGIAPAGEEDMKRLRPIILDYCAQLSLEPDRILNSTLFHRLTPVSHRPFGSKYAS